MRCSLVVLFWKLLKKTEKYSWLPQNLISLGCGKKPKPPEPPPKQTSKKPQDLSVQAQVSAALRTDLGKYIHNVNNFIHTRGHSELNRIYESSHLDVILKQNISLQ